MVFASAGERELEWRIKPLGSLSIFVDFCWGMGVVLKNWDCPARSSVVKKLLFREWVWKLLLCSFLVYQYYQVLAMTSGWMLKLCLYFCWTCGGVVLFCGGSHLEKIAAQIPQSRAPAQQQQRIIFDQISANFTRLYCTDGRIPLQQSPASSAQF